MVVNVIRTLMMIKLINNSFVLHTQTKRRSVLKLESSHTVHIVGKWPQMSHLNFYTKNNICRIVQLQIFSFLLQKLTKTKTLKSNVYFWAFGVVHLKCGKRRLFDLFSNTLQFSLFSLYCRFMMLPTTRREWWSQKFAVVVCM